MQTEEQFRSDWQRVDAVFATIRGRSLAMSLLIASYDEKPGLGYDELARKIGMSPRTRTLRKALPGIEATGFVSQRGGLWSLDLAKLRATPEPPVGEEDEDDDQDSGSSGW